MAITETINLIVLRKATIRPLKQLSGMVRQACARAPDSSEEPTLPWFVSSQTIFPRGLCPPKPSK